MSVEILDTHQHLIHPDRLRYDWTSGIPALADRAFTYQDYLAAAADTGITRTLFMETDAAEWRDETAMVLEMADDPDTIVAGVIANCRPEDGDGFDAWLDTIADTRVVGLRRILHTEPDGLSRDDGFAANIRKLAGRGLSFDMCFLERQLPIAVELAAKCEGVQLVLDHCGVPAIAGGALDPWRQHIAELAAMPHVACKISGVIAYANPGEGTADTVRPWVEHCIESFGWDRVVWGGDWPVCNLNGDLGGWVATSRALVAGEDEANQRKLFHENAARIYAVPD